MNKRTLDLRNVFGMIVTFDDRQSLVSPDKPFEVVTELYPGGASAIHIHPHQDEMYRIQEGEMEFFTEGSWKKLKAGEQITIPRGTVHGFRNKGQEKAVALNIHDPGLRFGEMLETIHQHINARKITGTTGLRNLVYMSAITLQYNDVLTTVKPPYAVVQFMSRLGKALGYK